jgi:hypothetical protein
MTNTTPLKVNRASKQPFYTTIETPASSWIDDYTDWLEPTSRCCRTFTRNSTEHGDGDFCPASYPSTIFGEDQCRLCVPLTDEPRIGTLNLMVLYIPNLHFCKYPSPDLET